jgi:hypothetical protein
MVEALLYRLTGMTHVMGGAWAAISDWSGDSFNQFRLKRWVVVALFLI